ncbi:hypothetical protein ACFQ9V_02505 [Leifsonia sp. NPDC056665]|uniref:hypothetical protein n=1 Tax=Leifsonia sp. NPDC056665 TaxID=3345901 RepID=UPI0036984343
MTVRGSDLRSRVTRRWAGYVAMLIGALVVLATTAVARVELAGSGAGIELLIGSIVVGGGLVAFIVGTWLWFLPSARLRAELGRRHPEAVVDVACRDDFRGLIDVEALGVPERDLPYFVVLVADRAGIVIWAAGDPGSAPRLLATVPWGRLGPLALSVTPDTLPRYVVETTVDGDAWLQLTFGGIVPRSYPRSLRTLDALEAVRTAADSGVRS